MTARAVVVELGGRRELRVWAFAVEDQDGNELARRVVLGLGWRNDPVVEVPALSLPVEAVPALVRVLEELA
jgi:hypothetical protein